MKNLFKVLALVLVLVACSDFFPEKVVERNGPPVNPSGGLPEKAVLDEKACAYGELADKDSRRQFLWNLATKSVCPKVRDFRYNLTLLRLSAQQLCLGQPTLRDERALDLNWYGTMAAYQYLVANPMEPLRMKGANGTGLDMEIYSWPANNKHALNIELIKASRDGDAYVMNLAPSRKGLTAVEKLVVNKEVILPPGLSGRLRPEEEAFNALPKDQRQRARCVVLNRMIEDIGRYTETLYSEWDASQKQYPRRMLQKLVGGSAPMVLNEVSDGLFYLEKVKDFKLGLPLGLNARCLKDRCPEEIELALSGAGVEALRANFEALRDGMIGTQGPGFLNLVREVGRADVANNMENIIQGMELALKDVELAGDLTAQLMSADKAQCNDVSSPVPLCRLFWHYKNFSVIFRSDFATALNLNPPRSETDND
jgi:hypothetical protein